MSRFFDTAGEIDRLLAETLPCVVCGSNEGRSVQLRRGQSESLCGSCVRWWFNDILPLRWNDAARRLS